MRGICGRVRSDVFTVDGSYRTGDLGRLDADGYLWYSGRLDDMVKVKGATVYPSEVEAALRSVTEVGSGLRHRRARRQRADPRSPRWSSPTLRSTSYAVP